MTSDWRSRWLVTVASDVGARNGIGWEFASLRQEGVWAVFREDGGEVPVFSSARGDGELPPPDELEAMTQEAVSDLLAGAHVADEVGWLTRNISAALLLASRHVLTWQGEEWALESEEDIASNVWASPAEGRTPFAWLRGRGIEHSSLIGVYQDESAFGLCFIPTFDPQLPDVDQGSRRSCRDAPLVTGRINGVEVVLDTSIGEESVQELVTEALLHGDTSSTLMIAAEAYSRHEWHLYDESVVVLPGTASADALAWVPPRRAWRPTGAPGR